MTTRIENVTVLGTGVLGSQIAYHTAYSGLAVTAYDISDKILDRARKRFEAESATQVRVIEETTLAKRGGCAGNRN